MPAGSRCREQGAGWREQVARRREKLAVAAAARAGEAGLAAPAFSSRTRRGRPAARGEHEPKVLEAGEIAAAGGELGKAAVLGQQGAAGATRAR